MPLPSNWVSGETITASKLNAWNSALAAFERVSDTISFARSTYTGFGTQTPANPVHIQQASNQLAAIKTVNAAGNRRIEIGHYPAYGDVFNDINAFGGDLRFYAENSLLAMRSGLRLSRYSTQPPLSGLSSNGDCALYMKDSKLVVAYNDGGTIRYKYLDLAGTGTTWIHSTTAP